MTFREFAHRLLEPASIWIMVAGIVFLCQPWDAFLHQWSVLVMLIGFVGFNVAIHTPPPEPDDRASLDETGSGASVADAAGPGQRHG